MKEFKPLRLELDDKRAPARTMTTKGEDKIFYILNKDVMLAKCEWRDDNHARLLENYGLPSFISNYLDSWLGGRTPPKHRTNIKRVLKQLGLTSVRSIIEVSQGLSLIDTLWVTEDLDKKWDRVNLFENPFNELIARLAFSGLSYDDIVGSSSPEFGTDGMLAKCWRRVGLNGEPGVWLYKTGTYPEMEALKELELQGADNLAELKPWENLPETGLEPYSEIASAQVLSELGWSHVPYTLGTYRGKTVSVCPIMTTVDCMFQNMKTFRLWKQGDVLDLADRFKFLEELSKMYVFDYVILGVDRHAGNYGVQLNADTFDYLGFNPLFDHGISLLSLWDNDDTTYEEFLERMDDKYPELERNARTVKALGFRFPELEALESFVFDDGRFGIYPPWALRKIEEIMRVRLHQFYSL